MKIKKGKERIVQNSSDVLDIICFEACENIRDLIFNIKELRKDIDILKQKNN